MPSPPAKEEYLAGKVVIVTGSAKHNGIGFTTALALAEHGANVSKCLWVFYLRVKVSEKEGCLVGSCVSRGTEGNPETVVKQVKYIITLLYKVVFFFPHKWESYVPAAHYAITTLDHLGFFQYSARSTEQIWIIQGLQDFAYYDADSGCIQDVAEYCQASWLGLLQRYPENVVILIGKLYFPFLTTPHVLDLSRATSRRPGKVES
jgi:hypothetical protein